MGTVLRRAATAAVIASLATALMQVPAGADEVPDPTPTEATPTATPPADPIPTEPTPTQTTPAPVEPTPVKATAAPSAKPTLMVVGDSMSASFRYRYRADDHGHVRAWWSYVADAIGTGAPVVSAAAGSGMQMRGTTQRNPDAGDLGDLDDPNERCGGGSTFGDRLGAVATARPDILIVAGGRNDFKVCGSDGRASRATVEQSRVAIYAYLKALRKTLANAGLEDTKVYVMTPWSSSFETYRDPITTYVERYARTFGLSWIQLPALPRSYTSDGTHPTGPGSSWLARQVLASSDIARASGKTSTAVKPVAVRCAGYTACRSTYGKARVAVSYHRAGRGSRSWSQVAGSDSNYVAHRLTHDGRRTARIPASAAAKWRSAARSFGVPIASRPTKGSIAWWPHDPSDPTSTAGHVAYVEAYKSDGTGVWVSEVRKGSYRWVYYAGSELPRGYLTFKKATGAPVGRVTSASSTSHQKVTIAGFVGDSDRHGTRVKLAVKVSKGSRSVTIPVSSKVPYSFTSSVRSSKMPTGRVRVRVYAYDVKGSKGTSRVTVGSFPLTVR